MFFALMKMTWREPATIIILSYMPGRHVSSNTVNEKYTILYLENERLSRPKRFNKHIFKKQHTRMDKYGSGSRYNLVNLTFIGPASSW